MAAYTFTNNSGAGDGLWSTLANWTVGSPSVPPLNSTNGTATDTITINAAVCTLDVSLTISTGTVQFSTTACTFVQNSGKTITLNSTGTWNAAATPAGSSFTFNGNITQSAGTFKVCLTGPATVVLAGTNTITGGTFHGLSVVTSGSPTLTLSGTLTGSSGTPTIILAQALTVAGTITLSSTAVVNMTGSVGSLTLANNCSTASQAISTDPATTFTVGGSMNFSWAQGSMSTGTAAGTWTLSSSNPKLFLNASFGPSSVTLSGTYALSGGGLTTINANPADANGCTSTISGTFNIGASSGLTIMAGGAPAGTCTLSGTINLNNSTSTLTVFGSTNTGLAMTLAAGCAIKATTAGGIVNCVSATNGSLVLTGGSVLMQSGSTLTFGVANCTPGGTTFNVSSQPLFQLYAIQNRLDIGLSNTLVLNGFIGSTYYVTAHDSTNQLRFDTSPPSNEAFSAAHWASRYASAMTDANGIGRFSFTIPSNTPADTYVFTAYRQTAAAPAIDSQPLGTVSIVWDGSAIVRGTAAPTAAAIRTEIDSNSTQLAAIKAKTDTIVVPPTAAAIRTEIDSNSTQLAAIKAKTDTITTAPSAASIRSEIDTNSTQLALIITNQATIFGAIPGPAPTAAAVRAEIDTNSTQLAAIKAKTDTITAPPTAAAIRTEMDSNSTQLAAIKAKTDTIVVPPTAAQNRAEMDTNSTQLAAIKAKTDTITGGGGGGATAVEVRQEMDANSTQLAAIKAKTDLITSGGGGSAAGPGASQCTLRIVIGSATIENAQVWLTTDAGGADTVASGITNDQGKVKFLLDEGLAYYVWAQKKGINPILGQAYVAVADP